MVRFTIGEYIRNIGYNVISIVLITTTFIACTIFLSNINEQLRMSRLLEPYLNEDSIIIGRKGYDFDVTTLTDYDRSFMTREVFCLSDNIPDLQGCLVYDEYSMDNFRPRLSRGAYPNDKNSEPGVLQVLVSENNMGINVGDVILLDFFSEAGAMEGKLVTVSAKVTGIISSGQKLLIGGGAHISKDMPTSDIFETYSYEQLGYAIVITTENEFMKLPEKVLEYNYRCIVKFNDDISDEDRDANHKKVYEYERMNGSTGTEIFPAAGEFIDRQEEELKDMIIKYIPLSIAVLIMVTICIVCMISIKNANSMRYYATLYMCGMPHKNAVIISGIEMLFNNVIAITLALIFIKIQNDLKVLGVINCYYGLPQTLVMIGICVLMVCCTMVITGKTLKERTPMDVLRDTAY